MLAVDKYTVRELTLDEIGMVGGGTFTNGDIWDAITMSTQPCIATTTSTSTMACYSTTTTTATTTSAWCQSGTFTS